MSDSETPEGKSSDTEAPSDPPPEDVEDLVWIHWKDDYWAERDEATPQPDHAHNTTWSGDGANNTGQEALLQANRDLALALIPVLAVLAVVLVLTLLGNALVCVVYRARFRRNTASLFVVFLAALELVVVGVGVPMETAILALPLLFTSGMACKAARYVQTASVLAVTLTLAAIAVDRYLKLTRPTNLLLGRWARRLCVGAVILPLCLALPALILFGVHTVPLSPPVLDVSGARCGVEDGMVLSPVAVVFVAMVLAPFFLATVVMATLYAAMFVRICRRKSAARGERVSPARREYPRKHRFVTEDSTSSCGGGERGDETRKLPVSNTVSGSSGGGGGGGDRWSGGGDRGHAPRSGRSSPGVDPARVPLKSGVKESARIGQGSSTTVDVQSTQMTWIFFVVTLTHLLLLLPFLVVRCLQALGAGQGAEPQALGMVLLYETCTRLYLLHPPAVPVVYLVCNHNFRCETRLFLLKVGRFCRKQPPAPSTPARAGSR